MPTLWYLISLACSNYFINILIFTFFYLATCCGRLYIFNTNEIYLDDTYLLTDWRTDSLTHSLTDWLTDWLTDLHTNNRVVTGLSTKPALIRPAKTKSNLVVIVVNLQKWAVGVLVDPLEYVVAYLFWGLCGFNN